jgi:pimeloyl-ACP methyl ester carboxylesterase
MGENFFQLERSALARFGLAASIRSLDINGRRGRALVTGNGPDVVLLPGGSMPAAGWAPLMAELDGLRLTALELPGFCGPSEPLVLSPDTIRHSAVRYLDAALDELGIPRASFIGNSMGGLWALWFALDRPERVRSIITMGCPALLPGTAAPLPMRLMSVRPLGRLMMLLMRPSVEQVEKTLAGAGVNLSTAPEVRDLIVALEQQPSYTAAWLNLMNTTLQLTGSRRNVALTDHQLAAITQPVTMLWGDGDPFGAVSAGQRASRIIPNAEFHLLPGGHAPWMNPDGRAAGLAREFLAHQRV